MSRGRRSVEYLLVDGQTAGSGETFDWTQLKVPRGASRKGFMLAGGLDPSNVADAVRAVSAPRPALMQTATWCTAEPACAPHDTMLSWHSNPITILQNSKKLVSSTSSLHHCVNPGSISGTHIDVHVAAAERGLRG